MRIEVGSGYGRHQGRGPQENHRSAIITDQSSVSIPMTQASSNGVDHTIREIAGVWPDQYDANVNSPAGGRTCASGPAALPLRNLRAHSAGSSGASLSRRTSAAAPRRCPERRLMDAARAR